VGCFGKYGNHQIKSIGERNEKTLFLIGGIILCLVLAAGMYFLATSMLDSIYSYRSPLAANPPAAGEQLGVPATRRVVIILVDGLRVDSAANAELMPTLEKLREQGASAVVHSRPPSYSEPAYSTIMTGAWQEINSGPVFNFGLWRDQTNHPGHDLHSCQPGWSEDRSVRLLLVPGNDPDRDFE